VLDGVTVDAPELDLKRGSDGVVELERLFGAESGGHQDVRRATRAARRGRTRSASCT
jgi:hypothetical protein